MLVCLRQAGFEFLQLLFALALPAVGLGHGRLEVSGAPHGLCGYPGGLAEQGAGRAFEAAVGEEQARGELSASSRFFRAPSRRPRPRASIPRAEAGSEGC